MSLLWNLKGPGFPRETRVWGRVSALLGDLKHPRMDPVERQVVVDGRPCVGPRRELPRETIPIAS